MTTTTPTQVRVNLSGLLKRALAGDDIGIVYNGQIIALRPVRVSSTDYVESEYGLSPEEWSRAAKNLHAKAQKALKTGQAKRFTGNIEDAL
jgi:antitoxin (DNA-binding transcriptional repressor) of toxin-antitoxin stability system